MTEQIERELVELFHDRAQRLDVLPPLPAAQVRRARLQSGLAVASVVAVLAGGGVVGVRLADRPSAAGASLANSTGDPASDLEQIAARMANGRWHVVIRFGQDAGATTQQEMVVDFDGPAKNAIARSGDRTTDIEVDGRSYVALPTDNELTKYLPAGAKWQRMPARGIGLGVGNQIGLGITDFNLSGAHVTRTAAGFRVEQNGTAAGSTVTDIRVARGAISSIHNVVTLDAPTFPGQSGGPHQFVTDATVSPLTGPLTVTAPDPRTVITNAQWQAAMEKLNVGITTVRPAHPQACRTTSTTDRNGFSSGTVECSSQMTATLTPVSPAPTPSHS